MKLVFIHGWALDAGLWKDVSALLPDFKQEHPNSGYFGKAVLSAEDNEPSILVGHSLGFVKGLQMKKNWQGWIAINSFPRFVKKDSLPGCASAVELREIGSRLAKNPQKTVQDFHHFAGVTTPPQGDINTDALREGLDELRRLDAGSTAKDISAGLVLASRNDPLVPAETSEALAEGKTLIWHENGGHILPQTDAAFCAKAIRDFMERHDFIRA